MDKEAALLILQCEPNLDLDDHMLMLLFEFKNKLINSSFHPRLVDQRLNKLNKQIEAFYFLKNQSYQILSKDKFNFDLSNDKLEAFNQFEQIKAALKNQLYNSNEPEHIISVILELKELNLQWWAVLISDYSGDDINENKELDQMSMYNQLTDWKAYLYGTDVLQNDNFAPLKKELDRIYKIRKSYV